MRTTAGSRAAAVALGAILLACPVWADVIAPADVTGVAANPGANPNDVELSWAAVTTDAAGNAETVTQYNIYKGATKDFVPDKSGGSNLIGTSATTSFVDAGARIDPTPGFYLVSAVDGDGNEGRTRASTIGAPVLSGDWTETSIDVNWGDVPGAVNYKVYYGRESGVYESVDDVGSATSHSLAGLELWVNWYIAVTAVDDQGNESLFSNEHIDAVAGRVRVRAHDDDKLCWGADKCTPTDPSHVQRSNGWELMVPATFPEGDWSRVLVRFTMDSKLCNPPAQQNTSKCGTGNPCLHPPCNGGYNTCGDPWDRTAFLYMVLDDCIEQGGGCRTHNNIELIHAVTPFGSDAAPPDGTGVIPGRVLEMDVTPFTSLFTGERYLGAYIGHFVQGGWHVTTEFEFSKRPDEVSPKPPADGIQVLFFGNQSPPTAALSIPSDATEVYTRLFTSGHGGNQACSGGSADGQSCDTGCPGGSCQNCDEFCQRTNQILVDSSVAWSAIPWRTDCSPASLFDCQNWNACGWPSCTFSRAGWCPGYIACHENAPCDNDLDMTSILAPGASYNVDYNVTPLNGSWSVSLVAYWYVN